MQKKVSVRTAAQMLGCTRKYLFDLLYESRLPGAHKNGRLWEIPVQAVEAYRKAREVKNA